MIVDIAIEREIRRKQIPAVRDSTSQHKYIIIIIITALLKRAYSNK